MSPDDLRLSPDGSRLYVSAQGTIGVYDGKLAIFSRDAGSGALSLLDLLADDTNGVEGLKGALGLDVSPDGRSVYVASEQDVPPLSTQIERGVVAVFAPEPAAGAEALAALAALAVLAQPSSPSQSRGRRKTS